MSLLQQLIETQGVREEHDNHSPFWIAGADTVWVVSGGAVDVFCVRREHDEPAGPRRFVFRATVGGVLLGAEFATVNAAYGLLAVATPGTLLQRLSAGQLQDFAATDDAVATELVTLADGWVSAFSRGLPRRLAPPDYEAITGGKTLDAPAGAFISPTERIVWMQIRQGSAQFLSLIHISEPTRPY